MADLPASGTATTGTAAPLRTVGRDPAGGWIWTLPDPVVPPRRTIPAPAAAGGIRFLSAAPGDPARPGAAYRRVRGERSVADAVRTTHPLDPVAVAELPRVLARVVTDRPRSSESTGPARAADDHLRAACTAFLDHCAGLEVRGAAEARAALTAPVVGADADGGDGGDGSDVDGAGVLGLGRVIWEVPRPRGEAAADVLVPEGRSSARADAARILAELTLTAALFSTAGKASAPSVGAVARGLVDELARRWRPWPRRFSSTVGLLVVDHARRLAQHRGLDGPTVAVELALARRLVEAAPFDPPDGRTP